MHSLPFPSPIASRGRDQPAQRHGVGSGATPACGGCHCRRTGDIGTLKVLGESGIGSGLRRIECLTGFGALQHYRDQECLIGDLAAALKSTPANMEKRLDQLLADNKNLSRENEKLKAKLNNEAVGELWQQAEEFAGIKVLSASVKADNVPALRQTMDTLRDHLPDSAIILAAPLEDKVAFAISVNGQAKDKLHAGKLIKEVAAVCGGSGGGRPDMAQAGGKDTDPAKIGQALELGRNLAKSSLQ